MGRSKKLPEGAAQVAVYLTPEEHLALQIIQGRRKKRGEERTSNSEVVADALWYSLERQEKVPRRQVEAVFTGTGAGRDSRVRPFLHKSE